jgi:hypothetical protein
MATDRNDGICPTNGRPYESPRDPRVVELFGMRDLNKVVYGDDRRNANSIRENEVRRMKDIKV